MGTEQGQHEALVYGGKKSDFLESKPMELKTQFGFIWSSLDILATLLNSI